MKHKIVVTQNLDLFPDQITRLKKLGEVKIYDTFAKDSNEWLTRCKGFDIICTGKFGLKEKIYDLNDVLISLPFVAVDWIDKQKIKQNNISVSNCPGCNRVAVSEWIVGMIFNLLRRFPEVIRTEKSMNEKAISLAGMKITILGKGNVGSRVGKICEALEMDITYFDKACNLYASVKDADIIVDCLGANKSTEGMLNKKFFSSLKKGSYFITVTGPKICDVDDMLDALDKGILVGAAHDSGGIQSGNVQDPFYQKLLKNQKVLATPHIAFLTDNTARVANDMMINNIAAWIKKKPINLI
jgi:D-lactate dehydrogenase